MSVLRSIETRIASLVEGTFGKVFRSSVQPVELARRLVKEMDEHQQRTVRNIYVPNRFDVYLSRDDHRQLSPYAAALTTELSEYLSEHARRNSFALLTRPRVHLHLDRDLALGKFGIAVRMEQPDAADPSRAAMADDAPADSGAGSTMVYAAVTPSTAVEPAASADSCAVFGPDGPFPLVSARVRVGRGRANDVVLQDASVSREHGEFAAAHGGSGWRVRDLGSTNGVTVNDSRVVGEHSLQLGDVVKFGNVAMRFDRWEIGSGDPTPSGER